MQFEEAKQYAIDMLNCQWVKWGHPGTKEANTHTEKEIYVKNTLLQKNHCKLCLNLNGCCFTENNYPKNHQHNHCHCHVERIPSITANAFCKIDKFELYVFAPKHMNKGKNKLFTDWGYSIMDSEYLKKEFERQANIAYQAGKYTLEDTIEYGQIINITINLKGHKIISGWLVYPNGKISLNTPFCGFAEEKNARI